MKAISLINRRLFLWGITAFLLIILSFYPAGISQAAKGGNNNKTEETAPAAPVGCETSTTDDNSEGFNLDDFEIDGPLTNDSGKLKLSVGDAAINPERIIVPFDQELWVSFIMEGAGYRSDFGYMYLEDAVEKDDDGNILYKTKNDTYEKYDETKEENDPDYYVKDDWGHKIEKYLKWQDSSGNPIIPYAKRHPVFVNINASAGILNSDNHLPGYSKRPNNDEGLKTYDDGTGILFIPYTGDNGKITRKDMTKSLGFFEGGTELIFFLSANHRYNTKDSSSYLTYFTKKEMNPDTYSSTYKGTNCHNLNPAGVVSGYGLPIFPPTTDNNYWVNCEPCEDNPDAICCECDPDVSNCQPCRTDEAKNGYTKCSTKNDTWKYKYQPFYKHYPLGKVGSGTWCIERGWLTKTAIDYIKEDYGIVLPEDASSVLTIQRGKKFSHIMVGAPPDDPNQWILGWEDLKGGGDTDHEDLVFRIERKTGGSATLKSKDNLKLTEEQYYTAVTIQVYDSLPCPGKTRIYYDISIDGGDSWTEVVNWDEVREIELNEDGTLKLDEEDQDKDGITDEPVMGEDIKNTWEPGNPVNTYRSGRIDFAGLGHSGRDLVWRARVESDAATDGGKSCSPDIINVKVTGSVASHAFFSRASPVVQGNVMYSGSYETPAMDWGPDKTLRGHFKANRIYDPASPTLALAKENAPADEADDITTATNHMVLWDAGEVMSSEDGKEPSERTIYMPDMTNVTQVSDEILKDEDGNQIRGDGETSFFIGNVSNYPISAGTLTITDNNETFHDLRADELEGNKGGQGTVRRSAGVVTMTFFTPPDKDVPITANYTYYTASPGLKEFNTNNVDSIMLGIDDFSMNKKFKYDFNGDGKFNNVDINGNGEPNDSDGDWLVEWIRGYADGTSKTNKKDWLLGAIDHSVPAVVIPPGIPSWYHGTKIDKDMKASYNKFREDNSTRKTVVYIGARDGMLHAFDAGQFRWGDNNKTDFEEMRGYFEWTGDESSTADYGTGEELWAFIPANLISRFKHNILKEEDQAYVDASPAIADVYIKDKWRTVILVAEGNGGDTVFCLDVTDPNNPSFLWEFGDPDLFRSISSPAIASIGIMLDKEGQKQWAAFFVSGKTYKDYLNPSIYAINIADGTIIRRIFLKDTENDPDGQGRGGTPSGQPAVIDSDGNGYVDRLYVGTDKGFMYKINIPDESKGEPTVCIINTNETFIDKDNTEKLVSGGERLPIYASPAVVVDKEHEDVKVFFGTGDSPYYAESINQEQNYAFFAYSDTMDKNSCSSADLKWYKEMESGHRIWASAFAAAGSIYFGTSTSDTEDPCEGYAEGDTSTNSGKLFGFDAETGESKIKDDKENDGIVVGNVISSPVVEDEHLYLKTAAIPEGTSFGGTDYNNEPWKPDTVETKVKSWQEIFE